MIRRVGRGRSGITLTEILISIMILGVGLISLATLFPLGLLRLRDAARLTRSAYLSESAAGDLGTRNLLNKSSFLNALTGPWYVLPLYTPQPYDPWIQDTPAYQANPYNVNNYGAYRGAGSSSLTGTPVMPPYGTIAGPGLPVAYDPLWRATSSATASTTGFYPGAAAEARFATGIGFVRQDPDGNDPSAHGLQRITNFPTTPIAGLVPPALAAAFGAVVPDVFVSPEDIILQDADNTANGANSPSTIVPDLTMASVNGLPAPQYDWKYTWMFTGQQSDCTSGAMFDGDIVIFENRPFGFDPPATTFATNGGNPYFTSTAPASGIATGETVVEAVFGYSRNIITSGSMGYGTATRSVLLRWSDKMPDPEIKVGSWIADVTYERNAGVDKFRSVDAPLNNGALQFFPYQRCYWYQVAKRTTAGPGISFSSDPGGVTYRQMVVWTTAPLRAFTLLNNSGNPVHVNAALVSPYVVNAFPRTVYTR
jgi:hypothetical protein